ncbi:MarR family transcriptional regulator [Dactylosporangium sp. NPDC048998]|uniref:MarR family transcriptional regulator n=1 Tax=Dactylosporangium sp. NPDC048998 TaxID=3363976 RepID=UPI00372291D0
MNGLELLVLGRTLMKLGGVALPALGSETLPASVRSVLIDIAQHPDSSVGEIAARTGFPQSHVSASIARLQDNGNVVTAPDPRDRRRTLVRTNPEQRGGLLVISGPPIDDALLQAIDDPRALPEVQAALETLQRHLVPPRDAATPTG